MSAHAVSSFMNIRQAPPKGVQPVQKFFRFVLITKGRIYPHVLQLQIAQERITIGIDRTIIDIPIPGTEKKHRPFQILGLIQCVDAIERTLELTGKSVIVALWTVSRIARKYSCTCSS